MRKFVVIFSTLLFIIFFVFSIDPLAAPKTLKQGIYTIKDLHLTPGISHTVQNTSPNEYVYFVISDSNEISYQSIQLKPLSGKYKLEPVREEFIVLVVGKGKVVIS